MRTIPRLLSLCLSFVTLQTMAQSKSPSQTLTARENYIETYSDWAVREMKRTGIPASITLAQGILESGNGQSRLATEGNNHFGIKCHEDWDGRTMFLDDDRPDECFRVYRNARQSFKDHSEFLVSRSRYDALFSLDPRDYRGWAIGLKSAGYATSPTYADLLIKIIQDEGLEQFDQKVIKPAQRGIKANERYQMTPNGAGYFVLSTGETVEMLAFDLGITLDKLLIFNDANYTWSPEPGDRIYVAKKKRKFDRKLREITTCRMMADETTWDVAQRYGIRLSALYQMNAWPLGYQPAEGELIRLQGPLLKPAMDQASL